MKKADLINGAYSQLKISGLTVDPSPDDLAIALDRLEDMASEWYSRNVRCNYNFESDPDPDTEAGIQRAYKQAFETNLAVWLANDFGKEISPLLYRRASASYSALSSSVFPLRQTAYPARQPVGSGNVRGGRYIRFYPGQDNVDLTATTKKDKDATEGYELSWAWWLTTGNTLVASEWFIEEGDNKLILTAPTFTDDAAQITVSGGTLGWVYRLTNRVTSSSGRSNDQSIYIGIV